MGGGTTLRHDEHARTAAARDDGGEPQRYGAVRCAATRAGPWRASPVNLSFGILVVASSLSTADAAVENRWNVGADGQSCDTVCAASGGGTTLACNAARQNAVDSGAEFQLISDSFVAGGGTAIGCSGYGFELRAARHIARAPALAGPKAP